MKLRQDWKKEWSRHASEVMTGIAVRKETNLSQLISMSGQENKQMSNWSRNLHEDRKQDTMSQHEREVMTKDQIDLQQKRCRDMKKDQIGLQ